MIATGRANAGTHMRGGISRGALTAAMLWAFGYLERVATAAFDDFRPALLLATESADRLRDEMTVVPWAPSLWLTAGAAGLTAAIFALDPASSGIVGLSSPVAAILYLVQAFATAILLIVLYRLLRHMQLVQQALARWVVVDPFRPGPLNALSRITATTGVTLVLLVGSSTFVVPLPSDLGAFLLNWAPYVIAPPVIATIAFVVPLYGTHQRLVAEKARLHGEADERLKGLLTEVNRAIDDRDLDGLDPLTRAVAAVLQQREIVAKLSTWPWSSGTARGFLSAILLPIALFVAQRFLAQVL